MGLTRRKLFKGGLLFSLFAGVPLLALKSKNKNVKMVRTFHFPHGANDRVSEELKTYMNHEELYFLDTEFQLHGKLLSINYSKPHPKRIVVTRVFDNQTACDEWRKLYKEKCVRDHANLTLFSHRLEEKILPA